MTSQVVAANCRIALFLPSLRLGGAERAAVNIAREASRRGIDVDVLLQKKDGALLSQVPEGVRVLDLHTSSVRRCIPGLVGYMRMNRPHAVLSFMSHCNLIALMASLLSRSRPRIIGSEHGLPAWLRSQGLSSLRTWVLQQLVRVLYPRMDALVCVSDGLRQVFAYAAPGIASRINVVPNPVDVDAITACSQMPLMSALFERTDPLVAAAGRFVPEKNFSLLLEAFALVHAETNARLILLGEGPLRTQLSEDIDRLGLQGAVVMPGMVDNPFAYFARASVFASSSDSEGFGNVLVEAMASGVPVVSTDCPYGPAEILDGGKYGRLVPIGNPSLLARAILAELRSPSVPRDVLIGRAREFGVASIVDRLLHVLLHDVSGCGSGG